MSIREPDSVLKPVQEINALEPSLQKTVLSMEEPVPSFQEPVFSQTKPFIAVEQLTSGMIPPDSDMLYPQLYSDPKPTTAPSNITPTTKPTNNISKDNEYLNALFALINPTSKVVKTPTSKDINSHPATAQVPIKKENNFIVDLEEVAELTKDNKRSDEKEDDQFFKVKQQKKPIHQTQVQK